MVCKILVEEIPSLNVLKRAIPDILEHRFRHIVDSPSKVNPMFVSSFCTISALAKMPVLKLHHDKAI